MERKESLLELFQDLGCTVESDAVLEKCFELCKLYNVDIEKLTELWLTFCVNNDNNIDPTVKALVEMENAILKKDDTHKLSNSTKENDAEPQQNTTDEHFIKNEAFESDDVLSIYGCSETQPSKCTKIQKSPEIETNADTQANSTTKSECLPASYVEKPSASPSQRNATDRGKILLSAGEKKTATSWKRTGDYSVEVIKSDEPHVPSDARYMYEILSKQGNLITFVCRSLGNRLFKTWSAMSGSNTSDDLRYVKNVRSINQTYFRTFGRINTNKQSTNTVTLEGCTRQKGTSVADSIELDFRNVKHYSVFSGQIVAVEATNPVGDVLYVKEIFAKAYAPPACAPRIESSINVFVAAGPFTASNNMHYQPLWDLMEKVASDEPHVLVLIGPFLEYTHSEIQDGLLKDTYQEFFEKTLAKIMESVKRSTQVVLVASNRDAHHEPIFPTPQYTIFNRKLFQNYLNLKLMPDPCTLDISGLKMGITSVDVIKHIGKEEISNISGMDRLSRLANHVLAQTCFYPVYPPSEDLNVDTELWEKYSFFDQQPHVLILPSDMRCYCKIINECVTLNPERMHKNTYAKLCIKPALNGKWSSDNILYEIVKV